MFTGIIEGLGTITAIHPSGQGSRFSITSDFDLTGTRIGDSIAVNGACLTAVILQGRRFTVDVSPETPELITLTSAPCSFSQVSSWAGNDVPGGRL